MSINTGGGGAGGNKRVVIEFIGNDANLTATLTRVNRNLKTMMEQTRTTVAGVGTSFETASTSATGFGTAVQTTATKTNTLTGALGNMNSINKTTTSGLDAMANSTKNVQGGLDSTNTLAGKSTDSIGKLGDAGEKTGGKMSKLKDAFSGNRGLIYSMGTIFGTITGVVAELQLLDDANAQVAEATDKLNKLQAEGKKGTTEYTQAQQQLEKANRFASFTTRNLSLAVANFVPEILLLATNLSKSEGIVGKISGAFGKLKGSTAGVGGALSNVGVGATAAAGGISRLSTAIKIFTGIAAVEVLGRVWTDLLQKGNPAINTIHEFGLELEKIPGIGPALKLFGDIMNQVFLPDQWAKEQERLKALANGTNEVGMATKGYVPDAKLLAEAEADLKTKQDALTKAQIMGGETVLKNKAVHEAQAKVNAILAGTYSELTGSIDDNRNSLLKNQGIWIDFSKTTKDVGTGLEDTTNAYTKWRDAGVDPANKAIKILSASVKQGVISQNELSKAVDLVIDPMVEVEGATDNTGKITKEAAVAAKQLTVEYLTHLIPSLKEAAEKQKTFFETMEEGGTSVSRFGNAIKLLGPGVKSASQSYAEFLDKIHVSIPAQKQLHAQLVQLATKDYPQLGDVTKLSNEQIMLQISAAEGDTDAIEALSKQAEEGAKSMDKLGKSAEEFAKEWAKHVEDALKAGEDALKDHVDNYEDGLQKLMDAFNAVHGDDKKPLFQKDFEKAEKNLNEFLAKFAKKLGHADLGGKEAAQKFAVDFAAKGTEGMSKATKNVFKPIIDYINIHKTEDPQTFFDGFIAFIGTQDQKVQNAFQSIMPDKTVSTRFGTDIGTNVADGIIDAIAAKKQELIKQIQESTLPTRFKPQNIVLGGSSGKPPKDTTPTKGTTTTNIITVDNSQAIKAMDMVVKRLEFISKMKVVPIIDVNIEKFIKGADVTVRRLGDIARIKTVPKIDVNIEKFIKGGDTVVKRLQSINKMKAVPKIDVNIEKAIKGMDTVVRRLESINKMHADPKITIHETTVKKVVTQGGANATLSNSNLDSNINTHANSNGNVNITLINTDEYGQQKKKKFKAELGRESYRFGT